jgi:hypothetical protein
MPAKSAPVGESKTATRRQSRARALQSPTFQRRLETKTLSTRVQLPAFLHLQPIWVSPAQAHFGGLKSAFAQTSRLVVNQLACETPPETPQPCQGSAAAVRDLDIAWVHACTSHQSVCVCVAQNRAVAATNTQASSVAQRRLTLHSSGPPTALRRQAQGLRPILRLPSGAQRRRGPLNSNVSHHKPTRRTGEYRVWPTPRIAGRQEPPSPNMHACG